MQNLMTLWSTFDLRRRIVVIGATLAMFLAIIGLSRIAATPSMALLYSGLDSSAAGEVVRSLDQRGVAYQVQGDSIRVDSNQRDMLRMTLAAEGLPASGTAGYELLDGLSGFGTTSQMFDAAYWRAKEGELARTIVASPAVRAARVHIAQAPSQPFQRDLTPTASVTVTSLTGNLTAVQARALRHLLAAAVAGMQPKDVSVIDSVAGFIPSDDEAPAPGAGGDARAAELKRNVERLLAARVGPGRAVVEVSVEVQTDSETVVERTFDPQGRVAISSDTEERSTSATQPAGDVTVASNLPAGDAAGAGDGRNQSSETRERVNYEVSETKREVLRAPGTLRRLSVAVLIDGQTLLNEDGTTSIQSRSEEELAVLRELVASAVGLDETRGDVLTLRSLSFEPLTGAGTLAEAVMFPVFGPVEVLTVIQLAVLAFVILMLGIFVLRPLLTGPARRPAELTAGGIPRALPGSVYGAETEGEGGAPPRVLTGEIDDGDLPQFPMVAHNDSEVAADDPMARLRRLIEERQAESVEILRGWMEVEEEKA